MTAVTQAQKLGRYEIVAELGKGAMGTVYKAVDPLLDRTVALKTINIPADDPDMAEYESRFYEEAKAVGGLNHPNIVTVYDVGKSDDKPYLAMEFLEGRELNKLGGKGRPLQVAHAIDIAAQVAEGLAYAHDHGVVHRDIKPANIMVVRDGFVKIADFGIARMRSAERGNEIGAVLGSPRYMSPEQVLRKRADHRSDIFSLGVVLYEMLTGSPPFAGGDLNAILFQIVNLVPPAPSTVNQEMPAMLDFVVAKALAKAPDERYSSAKEFADDLRECRKHIDSPAPLSLLDISRPAMIDPYAATPLMSQQYSVARQGDGAPDVPGATTTLGLAKEFDSFSATARLAAQTGVSETFNDLATQTVVPEALTVYGTLVRDQSSPRLVPSFGGNASMWDRRDRLIFSASIAVAVIVAAVILLI